MPVKEFYIRFIFNTNIMVKIPKVIYGSYVFKGPLNIGV